MTGRIVVEFNGNEVPEIVFEGDISFRNIDAMDVNLRFQYANVYLKSPEKRAHDAETLRLKNLESAEKEAKKIDKNVEIITEETKIEDDNND